jgi:S-adenosylmethionine:tRNA ribosyltransferase-isomerase
MTEKRWIDIDDYRYDLPNSFIARYPLPGRDQSRLLVYRDGTLTHQRFSDLPDLIPPDHLLVLNNTMVIQARLHFRKPTGAGIELLCLEPWEPADYHQSFAATRRCAWKCMVGNAKKWKQGELVREITLPGGPLILRAKIEKVLEDCYVIGFDWEPEGSSFGEIIGQAGTTPLPPYIARKAEESDRDRYQTIYHQDPGSVAAPTAGLHFSPDIFERLNARGIPRREVTLHVGAGTFVPVKQRNARLHVMHSETVEVSLEFLESWMNWGSRVIAVGTTTARSLETLYWMGVRLLSGTANGPGISDFRQWENESLPANIPLENSLAALTGFCRGSGTDPLTFSTGLMILPGYRFRTLSGLITNFHLPGSTLLLLIAALIGEDWRKVYQAALENGYRFLSYGDSSLIFPGQPASG